MVLHYCLLMVTCLSFKLQLHETGGKLKCILFFQRMFYLSLEKTRRHSYQHTIFKEKKYHDKIKMHLHTCSGFSIYLLFQWTWQGASKSLTHLAAAPRCGQCENILKQRELSSNFPVAMCLHSQLGINHFVHSLLSQQTDYRLMQSTNGLDLIFFPDINFRKLNTFFISCKIMASI